MLCSCSFSLVPLFPFERDFQDLRLEICGDLADREWWWYEEEIDTYGIWIWKHLHEVDCLITSLKNNYENCLFSLDPCVVLILPRNVGRQLQTLESLLWKWRPDKGSMRAPSGYIWISPIWCCMVTIFLRGSLIISEGSVVFFTPINESVVRHASRKWSASSSWLWISLLSVVHLLQRTILKTTEFESDTLCPSTKLASYQLLEVMIILWACSG